MVLTSILCSANRSDFSTLHLSSWDRISDSFSARFSFVPLLAFNFFFSLSFLPLLGRSNSPSPLCPFLLTRSAVTFPLAPPFFFFPPLPFSHNFFFAPMKIPAPFRLPFALPFNIFAPRLRKFRRSCLLSEYYRQVSPVGYESTGSFVSLFSFGRGFHFCCSFLGVLFPFLRRAFNCIV